MTRFQKKNLHHTDEEYFMGDRLTLPHGSIFIRGCEMWHIAKKKNSLGYTFSTAQRIMFGSDLSQKIKGMFYKLVN